MCYDLRTKYKTQMERFRLWNEQNKNFNKIIEEESYNLYHATGFAHPQVYVYTNAAPYEPLSASWGLLPSWAKESSIRNQTLNARGETIFEKPAFRESARAKRCLIYVDGFYEHHHYKSKTYPFYIFKKDESPMILAGLWNDWTDHTTGELINTFSIVTTTANPLMARIHNNPKLEGPRMPVILEEEFADEWLTPIHSDADKQQIQSLLQAYNQDKLDAYTVASLRGQNALGNVPDANTKIVYPELDFGQARLF